MLPDEDDTKLEMEERPPFNSYSVSPPPPPSAFTFPPKRPAENPQVLHLPPASPLTAAQFSADPFMDPNPFSLATPSPNRSSFARSTNRVRSPVSMASSITAASSADEDPFRDDDDDDRRDPRKDTLYGITNAYAGTDEPEPVPIAPLSVSSHRPPSPIDSKKGALNSDTNPPSGRAPVTVNYSRPGRPLVASHDDTGSNDARPPKSAAGALKEDMSTYTSSKGIIDNNPSSSSTKTFVPDQSPLTRDPNVGAPVIRIQDADRPEEWQPLQSLGVQHSPNYRSPTLSVYERYNEAEPVPTVR
ncbi:hypothetical protein BT69DRAFT_1086021 [Atractiella rhizophila]|nr:hypothetical protein BT69DRAFT_1086021 [Atractiella rhizophila]